MIELNIVMSGLTAGLAMFFAVRRQPVLAALNTASCVALVLIFAWKLVTKCP